MCSRQNRDGSVTVLDGRPRHDDEQQSEADSVGIARVQRVKEESGELVGLFGPHAWRQIIRGSTIFWHRVRPGPLRHVWGSEVHIMKLVQAMGWAFVLTAAACSSSSNVSSSEATVSSDECQSRCYAIVDRCAGVEGKTATPSQKSSQCDGRCTNATDAQLSCMESVGCSTSKADKCFSSPSGSGSGSKDAGATSKDAGTTTTSMSCSCDVWSSSSSWHFCENLNAPCPGTHGACLLQESESSGTCEINCTSLAGAQPSWCPSGSTCQSTGKKTRNGSTLYSCQ